MNFEQVCVNNIHLHIIDLILRLITQTLIPLYVTKWGSGAIGPSTKKVLCALLGTLLIQQLLQSDLTATTKSRVQRYVYTQAVKHQYIHYIYNDKSKNIQNKDLVNTHRGLCGLTSDVKKFLLFIFINAARAFIFRKHGILAVCIFLSFIVIAIVQLPIINVVMKRATLDHFQYERAYISQAQSILKSTSQIRTYKLLGNSIKQCHGNSLLSVRIRLLVFNVFLVIVLGLVGFLFAKMLSSNIGPVSRIAFGFSVLDSVKDLSGVVKSTISTVRNIHLIQSSVPGSFFNTTFRVPNMIKGTPQNSDTGTAMKIESLVFSYPGKPYPTIQNLSTELLPGSRTIVCGKNGQGKSTLLKLMAHKLIPDEGRLSLFGKFYDSELHTGNLIGFYDSNMILPPATVNDTLKYLNPSYDDTKVVGLLDKWGLTQVLNTRKINLGSIYPGELSIGQAQFVVVLAVLMSQNDIILLDEPVANLHSVFKDAILGIIQNHLPNTTFVIVSHDDRMSGICNNTVYI